MRTTIWRPNVRVTLDDNGEVEDTESGGDESTKKGTKRKIAPRTKGPCEHGVKYRSNCKVCGACPHGRQRSVPGSAAGLESASTVVSAIIARSAAVHQSASTVVSALGARSAVGLKSASSTVMERSKCKECGGASICEHGRERSKCKECGGASIFEHGRRRTRCKECGGAQSASTVVGALRARSAAGTLRRRQPRR